MKKNISEVLASVTNVSVNKFGVYNENNVFTDACGLVNSPVKPGEVILYNFNLMSGKTDVKRVNLDFLHCNIPALVNAFREYWYYLVGKTLDEKWADFADVVEDDLTAEEKPVFECVKKRHAHAVKILKPYTDTKAAKVCPTISDMVKAVYGCKEDAFSKSVLDAFAGVKNEINKLNDTTIEDETKLPNLKALRAELNKLTAALWRESDVCNKWVFNANAALTADVYRVAYEGRKLDKDGNYRRKMAKGKRVLCEVIFACIESLQQKAANAASEAAND